MADVQKRLRDRLSPLRSAFKKAVSPKAPWYVKVARTLALVLALYPAFEFGLMAHLPGRGLTGPERAELSMVFKSAVDPDKIHIHASKAMDFIVNPRSDSETVILGHTRGSTIVTTRDMYQPDFARTKDDMAQEVFLHESVHVWQAQNRPLQMAVAVLKEGLQREGSGLDGYYDYKLEKGKDLLAFTVEQQAVIVTDYYLHVQKGLPPEYCANDETGAALRRLYECTLAQFKADPAYIRRSPLPLR